MINIDLQNVGKQFNTEWIFSGISIEISSDKPTAILGSNGSGKSTLLQVILSAITPTTGSITYLKDNLKINSDDAFRLMSISAPYIELIEEFTLIEMILFHSKLKPLLASPDEIIQICKLEKSTYKLIRNFSSGMKQRVKLALAILSEAPVILLDEPTSNLDQVGITWYNQIVSKYLLNRTIIVSSNSIEHEYSFCKQIINLEDYKTIPVRDSSLFY
jgi:ABC-type multidrug transport system ATPase subunit